MLPRWFDKWNRDNPKDIYGPAILVGAAGAAVFVAAALVAIGQPYSTDSMQTGPRGTGMSVARFVETLNAPDPGAEAFLATTVAPIVPGPDSQIAGDANPDAEPLLAGLTVENYDRVLAAMRAWTGIPDLLEDPENYQSVVARRMIEMTRFLNEDWGAHTNASGEAGVTCYTCHRAQPVPNNVWFRVGAVNTSAEGWSAIQNRATITSQFTSLPSDALEQYLLNDEIIGVHDLQSRVSRADANPAFIQHTERTYALVNYFANSLGVNCVFCHNTRAFYDPSQVTPQWGSAILAIDMVQEINNEYLAPLVEVLPPNRLGPVFADAPLAACATCHQGQQRPLRGLHVIADWPELATAGDPVYPAAN
jgi:photosynthetic reaction center cytochrome c subunit